MNRLSMQDMKFETLGLLAERLPNGHVVCNIDIVGGLGGEEVQADWGRHCGASYLLALSVVLRMQSYIQAIIDEQIPWAQEHFGLLMEATITCDDGTIVNIHCSRMARMLEAQFIASENDPDTLTLPMERIRDALQSYVHEIFPRQ